MEEFADWMISVSYIYVNTYVASRNSCSPEARLSFVSALVAVYLTTKK